MKKATFGAGCFWGIEAEFQHAHGVVQTEVGYCGGTVPNPSYEDVCTGRTNHAEVVQVTYNPDVISYEELLEVFWTIHDPTQLNRQGPDVGTQYRSVIFYHDDEQQTEAEESKQRFQSLGRFRRQIVTEIIPAQPFYPAEEYHQQYLRKRGLDSCSTDL